jgi:hypothetical protein
MLPAGVFRPHTFAHAPREAPKMHLHFRPRARCQVLPRVPEGQMSGFFLRQSRFALGAALFANQSKVCHIVCCKSILCKSNSLLKILTFLLFINQIHLVFSFKMQLLSFSKFKFPISSQF